MFLTQFAFAAGDSGAAQDSDNYLDQYKAAKKLINAWKKIRTKRQRRIGFKTYNAAYKSF